MTVAVNGIAHIQLTVSNPEACVPFWERLCHFLEMQTLLRNENVVYCIGSRTGILVRGAPEENRAYRFDQDKAGLHHICFRARSRADVDEIARFVREEAGATMVHDAEDGEQFAPGYYSVLFEDPDGIRVEVNLRSGQGTLRRGRSPWSGRLRPRRPLRRGRAAQSRVERDARPRRRVDIGFHRAAPFPPAKRKCRHGVRSAPIPFRGEGAHPLSVMRVDSRISRECRQLTTCAYPVIPLVRGNSPAGIVASEDVRADVSLQFAVSRLVRSPMRKRGSPDRRHDPESTRRRNRSVPKR